MNDGTMPRVVVGDPNDEATWIELCPGEAGVLVIPPGLCDASCPSPQCGGRPDRCGRFSFPQRCGEKAWQCSESDVVRPSEPWPRR